jgi:hypothetical protein
MPELQNACRHCRAFGADMHYAVLRGGQVEKVRLTNLLDEEKSKLAAFQKGADPARPSSGK